MFAKKSYGQHFLHDRSVVKKIIAAAELAPGDRVLEIGPGTGVLTEALVNTGAHVVAIEADRDLIDGLQKKFGDQIMLISGDALKQNISSLVRGKYQLVSNLPYNVASAVIEKFLSEEPKPSRMVIMVQKEVADRLLAKPGEMSVLSVACQLYADGQRVTNVSPGAFRPMPKVDSTVVRLDVRPATAPGQPRHPESVIALAKQGFRSRRKQLHRNLEEAGAASSEAVKAMLTKMGLSDRARAQELSVKQWIELYELLKHSVIL